MKGVSKCDWLYKMELGMCYRYGKLVFAPKIRIARLKHNHIISKKLVFVHISGSEAQNFYILQGHIGHMLPKIS